MKRWILEQQQGQQLLRLVDQPRHRQLLEELVDDGRLTAPLVYLPLKHLHLVPTIASHRRTATGGAVGPWCVPVCGSSCRPEALQARQAPPVARQIPVPFQGADVLPLAYVDPVDLRASLDIQREAGHGQVGRVRQEEMGSKNEARGVGRPRLSGPPGPSPQLPTPSSPAAGQSTAVPQGPGPPA